MKISLTKLFAQDGKSEKYEIPLTSETFSIGGQDYRVIEKHPVILGLTHEGNRVITITGSADLTMEIPCARCFSRTSELLRSISISFICLPLSWINNIISYIYAFVNIC